MPRPLFVDTDTASDDAVALVMALRHPDVEVVGIGVVAGNVPLEQAVQNALYTVELCGIPVPVHAGEAAPVALALETAQHVHGIDGVGDIELDLSGREASGIHAVDALLEASHEHAGSLTLVTLGPLTNIAGAVQRDPTLPDRIRRCVVMGAVADHVGNASPVAGELRRRARTNPCSGPPGHAPPARTPRRSPWSSDLGTAGCGRRPS